MSPGRRVVLIFELGKGRCGGGIFGLHACGVSLSRGTQPNLPLREPALRPFESVREMILGGLPLSAVKFKVNRPGVIKLNRVSFPSFESQHGSTTRLNV